ncbi:hypothetical protein CNR22_01115 [Sphingobacteriaceae bacterium]|nr:hypothetical protein CNR22_01115 [Sphingobacteriaceae bacterium]
MQRIISIFFVLVICFQSVSTFFIITSFYLNRSYISQNICVNRFDAVQLCKGSCYLDKQLKAKEKEQQKFPDLKQKEINLICQQTVFTLNREDAGVKLIPCTQTSAYSCAYKSSLFRPPRLV